MMPLSIKGHLIAIPQGVSKECVSQGNFHGASRVFTGDYRRGVGQESKMEMLGRHRVQQQPVASYWRPSQSPSCADSPCSSA